MISHRRTASTSTFWSSLLAGLALIPASSHALPSAMQADLAVRQSAMHHPAHKADRVISNANIYTLDGENTAHQNSSIAIKDGIITWIGPDAQLPSDLSSNIDIVDANGFYAMPGLIDAHVHMLSAGRALLKCNLNYAALSISELRAAIQVCLDNKDYRHSEKKSSEDWLVAVAWDRSGFLDKNGRDAQASDLDGLSPDRPIMLITSDVHTTYVNSRGLELTGITASTPNPDSGKIVHFPNGTPTGVFEDSAALMVFNQFATWTSAEYAEFARAAMKLLAENGITTFMDAGSTIYEPEAFKANFEADKVINRAYFCQALVPDLMKNATQAVKDEIAGLAQYMKEWTHDPQSATRPSIIWRHFKAMMDGIASAPAETAAMTEPYFVMQDNQLVAGNASNANTPNYNHTFLSNVMDTILSHNLSLHIHSIGDNSTLQVLQALESQSQTVPENRVAIAHLEFLDPSHWDRIKKSGASVIATYQWAQNSGAWNSLTGDYDTAQALGPARMAIAEPFGNLTDIGNAVIYGSDYPVDPFDPWLALKVGVTRTGDPNNKISAASQNPFWAGKINNLASISRELALRGMTTYAANWLKADKHIGSLEVGKYADLIITRDDYFKVAESDIGQNKVLATMLGGKATFMSPQLADYGIKLKNGEKRGSRARSHADLEAALWHPEARSLHEEYDSKIVNKQASLGRSMKAKKEGVAGGLSCGCPH